MKEHLQAIVWIISSVTLVTALGIAWLVWRVSKRDSEKKKARSSGHTATD